MATGPEHYREAEKVLEVIASGEHEGDPTILASLAAVAHVHATLALAAATAYPAVVAHVVADGDDARNWVDVV